MSITQKWAEVMFFLAQVAPPIKGISRVRKLIIMFKRECDTCHNSSLMRKQSGFKKLVKWKWYEIRNFINKFGWNSIFKKIFSITSGLNGLLILIGDKVRYKKGSKKLKPKGMVLVKGRNQGFSNPYFLKIWSTKT